MRVGHLAVIGILFVIAGCAQTGISPETPTGVGPGDEVVVAGSGPGAKMDRYLSAMASLGFSGAIIAAEGGQVVLRKGYGLADRGTRRPYTAETVQTHGSITKQMTAAAILLLESRGALAVDDPIAKFFTDAPADKQAITLHQLLTHSTGLPGAVGSDNEPIGAEAFLQQAWAAPLEFEPGTGWAYSNVGYSILGIVVERVSGQDYETFLRQQLMLPAGLAETGYVQPDWDSQRLAVGYRNGEPWGQVYRRGWREDGPGWHLRANGGMHTTVDDMHRWLATLQGEGVLTPEAAKRWTTGHVKEGGSDSMYAYGWAVHETEQGPMIAHNGGNGIFSADYVWLPQQDLFFYLQGNTSVMPAARQRDALLAAAFDSGFLMPPLVEPAADADPAVAQARTGSYPVDGGRIELAADDTRLIAALKGQGALDRMLGHDADQRERLAQLNARAMAMVDKLKAGREDAMAGLVGPDEDAAARARSMLNAIERAGNLQALTLVGSIANVPGSRFAGYGPWTTFVEADFGGLLQMWSMLWREDGTYSGTAIGPLSDVPSLVLVPVGDDRYTGVRREPPWDVRALHFEGDCLVVAGLRACRPQASEK